jgi:hypothetical protein
MAKGMVLNFAGEVSELGLTRVDREKLYGKKVRAVVDEAGKPAQAAYLSTDGSALLPPSCISLLSVDEHFDAVERSSLKAVDTAGAPLPLVPSTLGVEQPLKGPVPAQRVLEHQITTTYQLMPDKLGPNLLAALDRGEIYEARFNWREDWADAACFVLKNETGFFALIGDPTGFEYLQRDAAPAPATQDDAADEELDFNMM